MYIDDKDKATMWRMSAMCYVKGTTDTVDPHEVAVNSAIYADTLLESYLKRFQPEGKKK